LLQSGKFPNATELAERCEVSRRTIYRDLTTLEAAGIAVQYRSDRRGYELLRGAFLQPTRLEEKEALALVVLSRQWNGSNALGLIRHLRSGVVKLIQGLPEDLRIPIDSCAELVEDQATERVASPARQQLYDTILEALMLRRQLRVWNRDETDDSPQTTKLGIYRLVLIRDVWCLVGRSTAHRQVRIFRVPWIERVELTNDPYQIPPRFDLDRVLGGSLLWPSGRTRGEIEVLLRFHPSITRQVVEGFWHGSQQLSFDDDGQALLRLGVDRLDGLVSWVLSFQDRVEVLAPAALREDVRLAAERIAQIHRNPELDLRSSATSLADPGKRGE
jgi:predicted DNA-binding transcriptional regulator YafY